MKFSIILNLLVGNLVIFGCKSNAGLINIGVALILCIIAVVVEVIDRPAPKSDRDSRVAVDVLEALRLKNSESYQSN